MTNNLDVRIGANLCRIRSAAGLDCDTLATRTGLQPSLLAQYEAGRLRIPVEVLTRLAALLDRPLAHFFA